MGWLSDRISRHVEHDAERDERAARARRVGARTARESGAGAGLTAWARESTGATHDGQIQMSRVRCTVCHTDRVQRADGRPVAHKADGRQCPGGGASS
jgi:hypothetical protein